MNGEADRSAFGLAQAEPSRLDEIVSRCLGTTAHVTSCTVTPVGYPFGAIATAALLRVEGQAGTAAGDVRWSVFVKLLRSARLWPFLTVIPEAFRAHWVADFPWRLEIDAYRSRVGELLPGHLRLPRIYDIVEVDADHAAIWMEDVVVGPVEWDPPRFASAAYGLGVLAGRRPLGSDVVFAASDHSRRPGATMREFVFGRVRQGAARELADDDLWRHPALVAALASTGEAGIRAEVVAAFDRLDGWLDAMDALPQTYVHGDASPQNLLVPDDAPDTFVVIDFGFNSPHCVGFDLGQLLVGLVNAGELDAWRLPAIHAAILAPYLAGLVETGFVATAADVAEGCRLSLLVRSLFTAIPLEQLGEPDSPTLRNHLVNRIRLARFLLNGPGLAAAH